jgi:hypothetical protein
MKIHETSMKISDTAWNPWTCMGYICLEQRRWGIFYMVKAKHTCHICPPERNKLFKQRKWKLRLSGKHWLSPATHMSKWHVSRKPEMFPRSLRSFVSSRFLLNAWWEFDFRESVGIHFWKVWGLELGSLTWAGKPDAASFCGRLRCASWFPHFVYKNEGTLVQGASFDKWLKIRKWAYPRQSLLFS